MRVPRGLDAYYGRQVEAIDGDAGSWNILLTGGIRFESTDGRFAKPDLPVGISFISAANDGINWVLLFQTRDDQGNVITEQNVNLNPNQYQIYDQRVSNDPFVPDPIQADFDPETPEPPAPHLDGPITPPETPKPSEARTASRRGSKKVKA